MAENENTDTAELTWLPGLFSGDPRPEWDWRSNELAAPTHMHLEPSFKPELGLVYLQLSKDGKTLGVWLDRERVDSLKAGLETIASHAEQPGFFES